MTIATTTVSRHTNNDVITDKHKKLLTTSATTNCHLILSTFLFSHAAQDKLRNENKALRATIKDMKVENQLTATQLKRAKNSFCNYRHRHPDSEMAQETIVKVVIVVVIATSVVVVVVVE